jgi:phage gp29-like protein
MRHAKALQWEITLDLVLDIGKEEAGVLPHGAALELARAQAEIAACGHLSACVAVFTEGLKSAVVPFVLKNVTFPFAR